MHELFQLEHERARDNVWMEPPMSTRRQRVSNFGPFRVAGKRDKNIRFPKFARQSHSIQVQLLVKPGRAHNRTGQTHHSLTDLGSGDACRQLVFKRCNSSSAVFGLLNRGTVKMAHSGLLLRPHVAIIFQRQFFAFLHVRRLIAVHQIKPAPFRKCNTFVPTQINAHDIQALTPTMCA